MLRNKPLILYFIFLFLISCIEEYKPIIEIKDTNKYVVYGCVTNHEGYQTINISTTSNIENPLNIPINDCDVIISDDLGNIFQLEELNPGEYRVWIDQEYLNVGTSYKIDITTPEGTEISSDYDIMPDCANLDSVYYLREDIPTTNSDKPIQGIQFYTDFSGSDHHSQYYKYTIEETWEYHAQHPNQGFYNGTLTRIDPPDYSKLICWKTQMVPDILILSTNNLSENKYLKFPLHYVTSTAEKLVFGYSVLIKQYALSESSYFYWSKIKNNIMDEGGLYDTQPELIHGNLYNETNPNEEVLGYFYASSVKTKRIFIEEINELTLTYNYHCVDHILRYGLRSIHPGDWPAYILFVNDYPSKWLNDNCVDCTGRGGTNIKPDFWPY